MNKKNFDFKTDINFLETEKIRNFVKSIISEKRFSHTLATENEAVRLYNIYSPDSKCKTGLEKIRSAALLHDITKEFTQDEHYELCQKYGIILTDEDKKVEKCLHAKTAAYMAKEEFGADDEVFSAIYNHTLGSASMTLSDKILYLADYIEETRTYSDCVKVRKFFCCGIENAETEQQKHDVLNQTLLYSFNLTLSSLIEENLFIHGDAIKARNALI